MNSMKFFIWAVAALILAPLAQAQSYTVTDLGTLGGVASGAMAINDQGEVVGYADQSNGAQFGFTWTATEGMQSLGVPSGYSESLAQSVNNLGQVAGFIYSPVGFSHAAVWTKSGDVQDLGSIAGGSAASAATGINDSGEVVGYSDIADGDIHAFLWTRADGFEDLGTLGGYISVANGINASGEVVGYSYLAGNTIYHAFLWTKSGGMQDLGTLTGTTNSNALAVSASGRVVGSASTDSGLNTAFYWNDRQGMQSMNVGRLSVGLAINASNQVVGELGAHPANAFLWTQTQHLQDLNNLIPPNTGWVLEQAWGINRSGQIAATGTINGETHAALLTPVN
jgi:probable HAF family extracellular repeat protein